MVKQIKCVLLSGKIIRKSNSSNFRSWVQIGRTEIRKSLKTCMIRKQR